MHAQNQSRIEFHWELMFPLSALMYPALRASILGFQISGYDLKALNENLEILNGQQRALLYAGEIQPPWCANEPSSTFSPVPFNAPSGPFLPPTPQYRTTYWQTCTRRAR